MTAYSPVVPENNNDPRLFMTPRFELLIEGSGLPNNVLRDVSEFTYRDSLTELDQFELTVNNWDPERRKFKYIGSETEAELRQADKEENPYKLFEPCAKKVTVRFGYVDALITMMLGNFTTMETSFNQSGGSTLTVRGLNVFHSMRRKKYSTSWENKTPSQIAENIGSLNDGKTKRFPIPIKIIDGTKNGEQEIPFVTQSSQFDIDFLLNLARQHGYEIAIGKDKDKEVLLFGRPSEARMPVNYRLDWGRTLVEFKPALTTAGQFKSVTVKGWDRKKQKVIEEKVAFDDKELRGMNAKFGELVKQCDPREEQVVDLPVFSKADARKRALGLMRDNSARLIRATGTTIGLPDLRAGTKLDIQGVGARLSGEYLVTKTTHSMGEGGYTTKFECRLEDFKGKPR